jgi:hypothetical protein
MDGNFATWPNVSAPRAFIDRSRFLPCQTLARPGSADGIKFQVQRNSSVVGKNNCRSIAAYKKNPQRQSRKDFIF